MFKRGVGQEVYLCIGLSDGRHRVMFYFLQISLQLLEADKNHQCCSKELQGGERKGKRDWKVYG